MNSRLTLATTCKPFRGATASIQRNALASWAAIRPRPEILVIGDEPGVAETCLELGLRQIPEVERSEYGTPLLPGLLVAAERWATGDWIGLINADIMLTSSAEPTLEEACKHFDRFLLIARRWNLTVNEEWDFEASGWGEELERRARGQGILEPRFGGVDLFLFPRGAWGDVPLPAFAVGRGRWDSGILYQARARGLPVLDATERVFNVHQNHDYSHHPQDVMGVFKGPESLRNDEILGGEEFIFSSLNATHVFGHSGLRANRVVNPLLWLRRLATAPATTPWLRLLVPVVRSLAPVWRRARGVRNRVRALLRRGIVHRTPGDAMLPLPVEVPARSIYPTAIPPGGGVEDFDKAEALAINRARLELLESLRLPLEGRRVLDVGAGPGHLAQFFVKRSCQVLCLDGRTENVARMAALYPGLEGRVFDVERDAFGELGVFDVVFSFGLLYHVENPWRVIQAMASVCKDLLLLSTIVADDRRPLVLMEEETASFTQALRHVGSRPTPSFLVMALRSAGFAHVYAPAPPADHPDFLVSWRDDMASVRDGHPIRAMIVASRRPLENGRLVSVLKAG